MPTGKIEVIAGAMFSGKSDELLRRIRRAQIGGKPVQVFNPKTNNRERRDDVLATHNGDKIVAEPVSDVKELVGLVLGNTQVVAVDEVQFFDEHIVKAAEFLVSRGIEVILAGTDTDFRGEPFGPIPQLLAIADDVLKLHAVCVKCHRKATRSQRLVNGEPAPRNSPTIMVGGSETYEARCRDCYVPPQPQLAF